MLLRSEGWSQRKIAEALRISEDSVYDYLKAYIESKEYLHLTLVQKVI